jgi:hypothetical protein
MESYSGTDAGKERDFALVESLRLPDQVVFPFESCSGTPGPTPSAKHLFGGDRFPSYGAKLIHSAFNLFGPGGFHSCFGRRIIQGFHQTINKKATTFLGRLGRYWADKDKRLLEQLAKPAASFAP